MKGETHLAFRTARRATLRCLITVALLQISVDLAADLMQDEALCQRIATLATQGRIDALKREPDPGERDINEVDDMVPASGWGWFGYDWIVADGRKMALLRQSQSIMFVYEKRGERGHLVCAFDDLEGIRETLVVGQKEEVCKARTDPFGGLRRAYYPNERVSYARYLRDSDDRWLYRVSPDLEVDLDNNGRSDHVIEAQSMERSETGCVGGFSVIPTPKGSEFQPGYAVMSGCIPDWRVFQFPSTFEDLKELPDGWRMNERRGDHTYLEVASTPNRRIDSHQFPSDTPDLVRAVLDVTPAGPKLVCGWKGQWQTRPLTPYQAIVAAGGEQPWEYVLAQPDLDLAKIMINGGLPLPDRDALAQAVKAHRADVVALLLKHGVGAKLPVSVWAAEDVCAVSRETMDVLARFGATVESEDSDAARSDDEPPLPAPVRDLLARKCAPLDR